MKAPDPLQFAIELARIASEHNSENVIALDLRGRSAITDFVVIATGSSDRQRRAVADHAADYGKKLGNRPFGFAGYDTGNWVIVDFVHVVLHMFAQSHREFYDLELMWGDAPRVDWLKAESA